MSQDFIEILKKLITEQGKDALTNPSKSKSLLRDYTKNEFQKETRFIIRAVEAGAAKVINNANDLTACKKIQIRELHEEQGFTSDIAADIVNTLALVLRNDKTITEAEISNTTKMTIGERLSSQSGTSYDKGLEYFNNKEYDKAIQEFTEAIQQEPKHAMAYAYRARVYTCKDNYVMAMKDAEHAINIDTNCAMAYFTRGFVYRFKNEFDKAMADFNKAIQLDPELTDAYMLRASLYGDSQNDLTRAIEDYSQVIFLNPKNDVAYSFRGSCYGALEKTDMSIADFTNAILLNPKNGLNYIQRGLGYHLQGSYDMAINDYENAIRTGSIDNSLTITKQYIELAKQRRKPW